MTFMPDNRTQKELELLLDATKSILNFGNFEDTARNIFNSCKELTGATAGYVALLSKSGEENEVLFIDSGESDSEVNPYLDMPIRGLKGEPYKIQETIYDNDFMNSKHEKFLPNGNGLIPNVLFSPLKIEEKTVGIIGLSNKEADFTDDDARIVTAFSDLCSIALYNSWLIQKEGEMLGKLSNLNQSLELINSILKHDIINDLQVVSNSVELVFQGKTDSDLLKIINSRIANSMSLIHKMNAFEKLLWEEENNLVVLSLAEVLNQIIERYDTLDIEFKLEGEGYVLADQALYSALDNIISNAVKHSETNKIDIFITQEGDKSTLEIRDYGKGLPTELAEKINNKEYAIDKSNIAQLGLYIVIKTIDKYNGEFLIEPNSPNGTIMKLVLENPLSKKYH